MINDERRYQIADDKQNLNDREDFSDKEFYFNLCWWIRLLYLCRLGLLQEDNFILVREVLKKHKENEDEDLRFNYISEPYKLYYKITR